MGGPLLPEFPRGLAASKLYPVRSYCEFNVALLALLLLLPIPSIFIAFVGAEGPLRPISTDSLLDFDRNMPKALNAPFELGAGLTPRLWFSTMLFRFS